MRNIELKARLRDRACAKNACADLKATFQGDIHQVDTYFPVKEGRFKFRESQPGKHYLIYYRRDDEAGPKGCDYNLSEVDRSVLQTMCDALGVEVVVNKIRSLYLWHNVRIHLDRVEGLGDFIEFEAVLRDPYDDADGQRKLEHLQQAFGIAVEDLVRDSYRDLVKARG